MTLTTRQLFLNHVAQTTDFPLMLEIESAEGIYLYGKEGKKYIDLISGIGVSNVGHRHPKVIEAIKNQVDKYLHLMVYGEFVEYPQVKLAQLLSETLPDNLTSCYFVNSGSEAVEGAIKLAKRYTGKSKLISCKNSYHGSTHGALSLNGNEHFKSNFRPLLPGISHIEFGNENDLELITSEYAAIVIETIQGEAGVRIADKKYWQKLKQKCTETGTLLILDEIQCGFGRTGKFWAFEHYEIEPDIIVCAKGMGGGMPIGAFISSNEIMSTLKNNPILGHITTFGGHPVSCAASIATLQLVNNTELLIDVEKKGLLFKSFLKHPKIKEIRGLGLMLAVEFESFEFLKPLIDRLIEKGVLTDWFLNCDNSMRIAPPLIISENEIKKVCEIILEELG
jgi:putrescine aminotransferase